MQRRMLQVIMSLVLSAKGAFSREDIEEVMGKPFKWERPLGSNSNRDIQWYGEWGDPTGIRFAIGVGTEFIRMSAYHTKYVTEDVQKYSEDFLNEAQLYLTKVLELEWEVVV